MTILKKRPIEAFRHCLHVSVWRDGKRVGHPQAFQLESDAFRHVAQVVEPGMPTRRVRYFERFEPGDYPGVVIEEICTQGNERVYDMNGSKRLVWPT